MIRIRLLMRGIVADFRAVLHCQPLAGSRSKPRRRAAVRGPELPAIAAAVLIIIAGAVAYSNSFSGVFVLDDEPAIAQSPNVRSLWPLTAAMSAPADTTLSGRPVAALSFAIDGALSGGTLEGYHTTNLVIHLAAALLLFGVTRRTLSTPALRNRFSGAAPSDLPPEGGSHVFGRVTTLALIIALIFVVHPIQTGSVTYIVQRVESLMGLLYLATLYCAIRALETGGSDSVASRLRRDRLRLTTARSNGRGRVLWTGASVMACALGMGTKEVMATAPLMVMLWDYEFALNRMRDRKALYGLLASTWVILAVLVAGGHRSLSVGFGFAAWPWWRYLGTQTGVVAHYLRLAVVPTPLVLDYDWRAASSVAQVAVPGALVAGLLAATLWGLWRHSPAAFAGAWFFLILAPSSSVIPVVTEVAAEHRMYLPVAGVIALVVLGCHDFWRRMPRVSLATAAGVVLLFGRMTYARNEDYQDFDRIWSGTIAERPHNARARNNYATSLLMKGRYAEAEPHLRVALQENPSLVEAEANLGVALSAQGQPEEGAAHLRRAIEMRPDDASAHRNLGETYAMQDRLKDAAAEYEKALAIAKSKGDVNQARDLEQRLALIKRDLSQRAR
jgi:protein O-mannosyl-transferase